MKFAGAPGLGLVLSLASLGAHASLFEDQYLGLERAATQDALGGSSALDPFSAAANPAWFTRDAQLGFEAAYYQGSAGDEGESPGHSKALGFALQGRLGSRWQAGFLGSLPLGSQEVLDSGDVDERSSPWMSSGRAIVYWPFVGVRLGDGRWRAGLAMPVFFDADASARLELDSSDAQARTRVSLDPEASFVVGFRFEISPVWDLSLSYRHPQSAQANAFFSANIPLTATELSFAGDSQYLFAPRRLALQSSWQLSELVSWGVLVRFSNWAEMRSPYLKITDSTPALLVEKKSFAAENAWDAVVGGSFRLKSPWTLLASLRFQQSPFKDIPSFYDDDLWVGAVGVAHDGWLEGLRVSAQFRYEWVGNGAFYTWSGLGLGYSL